MTQEAKAPDNPVEEVNNSQEPTVAKESISSDEQIRKNINVDLAQRALSVSTNFMNPEVWKQMQIMAKAFKNSGALPSSIQNEYQLIMVMQAGFEMGMKPIESIKSLYIVNGSITIYAEALTRRLNEWGFNIEYKDEKDECTAIITHPKTQQEIKETYTFEQAVDSGYTLDRKGNLKVGWKPGENRLVKLRYGALRRAIKTRIAYVMGSASDIKEVAEDYSPPKKYEEAVVEKPDTPRAKGLMEVLESSKEQA